MDIWSNFHIQVYSYYKFIVITQNNNTEMQESGLSSASIRCD